jgi:NMD protein affecting ribosome stability and mRNA decay
MATQVTVFLECRQCGTPTPPQQWPQMFCAHCDHLLLQAQLRWLAKTADPLLDVLEDANTLERELMYE